MGKLDSKGFRLGFAVFVLFTGVAGDFWRDALSWYGYGVVVALVVAGSIMTLVHRRKTIRFAHLPYPLIAFLALAALSIAWSDYRLESVAGTILQILTTAAAVAVAVSVSWPELLVVLGWVFRLVLGLSFVFEFIVSAFIRHPIYPVWVVPDDPAHPAKLLYWSRDLLFKGDKIQGILGNSSLLAMAALLGLLVFAVQVATRSVGRISGWFWIVVAVAAIALTRSATIFLGIAVVVVVLLAVLAVRAAGTPRARGITYSVIVVLVVALGVVSIVFRTTILHLLGKSADFTGRIDIWNAVIHLAQQRPVVGWGWISYWAPWVSPFDHLIVKGGVQVLHAHDAWLDVWLQLGIVGLVVFGALVLSTLVRTWLMAIDRPVLGAGRTAPYGWLALLPLLLFVAQLVQSLAESRMLIEGGWMLLVLWAVRSKWNAVVDEPVPGRPRAKE